MPYSPVWLRARAVLNSWSDLWEREPLRGRGLTPPKRASSATINRNHEKVAPMPGVLGTLAVKL